MSNNPVDYYKQYFIDRDFERLDLFQILAERYAIESALYPGSFVHITPTFVFPITTYVDTDKRAKQFFEHPDLIDFIARRKTYPQDPIVTFYASDFHKPIGEPEESYDLLISQYAGFVSQHGKRYLKIGGRLLVNNSHGDASMASIDDDYEFKAVVIRRGGLHRINDRDLDSYFVPKKPVQVTKAYFERAQKGIGYKKTASSYLFQRVK
jgi:hypothetical protein